MVASIWDVRGTRIAIVARLIAAVLRLIHASPKAAILRRRPERAEEYLR
jgi:hypothetical protein